MVVRNHILCYNSRSKQERRLKMEENNVNAPEDKKKVNNKIMLTVSIVAIIIVAIVIVAVMVSRNSKPKENLNISNTHMQVTYNEYLGYSATITGIAKNTSGQNLSYASIEFSVYDASGINLGTALANINNLMEGDTWRFEATLLSFPSTSPSTYRLVNIIAYSI